MIIFLWLSLKIIITIILPFVSHFLRPSIVGDVDNWLGGLTLESWIYLDRTRL